MTHESDNDDEEDYDFEAVQKMSDFFQAETERNLNDLSELIDIARQKSKMKNRPIIERQRWMALVGKLIWYRDHIVENRMNKLNDIRHTEIERIIERMEKKAKENRGLR